MSHEVDIQDALTDAHAPHEEGGEGWLVSYADMMTLLVGFFVILQSFSSISPQKFEKVKQEASKVFGGEYQKPYKDLVDKLNADIKKLGISNQLILRDSDAGVEISFRGTLFFDSGSDAMNEEGIKILQILAPTIKSQAQLYQIKIEGHTDDSPISTAKFRNNWELSSLRACQVLEFFEQNGFSPKQLTAIGYGDTFPVVPNRDAQGNPIPENQNQNRRVVIVITKPNTTISGTAPVAPAGAAEPAPAEEPHKSEEPEEPAH